MVQKFFRENWIHFAALGVFLIVLFAFLGPGFTGQVLHQHDTTSWKAMAQSAFEYHDKTGVWPKWNTNMFSGMPNYQIAGGSGVNILPNFLKILSLGLPFPVGMFLIAALSFYFLGCTFKLNNYISIIGGCVYSLCTYNMVITAAGHETKMLAIAFIPAVLASIKVLFNKQYILGLFLCSFFFTLQLGSNHLQISYYLIFLAGPFIIYKLINTFKKNSKQAMLCLGILAIAGGIAVFNFASNLLPTNEYVKYTMRGGGNIKVGENGAIKDSVTKGLDNNYAFQYSHGKAELFTFGMPEAFGGRTPDSYDPAYNDGGDLVGSESNIVEKIESLSGDIIPEQAKQGLINNMQSQPKYWGSIGVTNGPWFIGSITLLLALIGFVVTKNKNKWWLLAAILFCTILAMGSNLLAVNNVLFKIVPFLNKFRAPATALFITQFSLIFMAVIALNELLKLNESKKQLINNEPSILNKEVNAIADNKNVFNTFKMVAFTLGGFLFIAIFYYIFGEFNTDRDASLIAQLAEQKANPAIGKAIVKGFVADRKGLFLSGILRLFVYAFVILGALWIYIKKLVPKEVVIAILGLLIVVDLFVVDAKYLSKDRWQDKDEYQKNFEKTASDIEILKDTAKNYRMLELNGGMFSDARPCYYHKNAAGYSPVKLRIYQDLIDAYLSNPGANINVLNMLNIKYVVPQNDKGVNMPAQLLPGALGNCWFVKKVINGETPAKELSLLKGLNVKDTAIISGEDFAKVTPFTTDTTATIKLTLNDADHLIYESNAKANQFAVFSEIYYPAGWNAYIDGKPADILKTNYVLRGIMVPEGKHKVEMKFEPKMVQLGNTLSLIGQILLYVLFALVVIKYATAYKKKQTT